VRAYVARGARLAAIFCGLLVGVVVAMPESMLAFAYNRPDAAQGADVLRVMTLAQGAFAMLGIATTVLTSMGRERTTAWLTLAATAAVAVACAVFVPSAAFGHAQLIRSAGASGIALAATLVAGGANVFSNGGR
jgi:stage V sporulation protein B